MAATTLYRSHSSLGDYFRRLRAKLGSPSAITAAAHKLARILFAMLRDRRSFDPQLLGSSTENFSAAVKTPCANTPLLSDLNLFLSRILPIQFLEGDGSGQGRYNYTMQEFPSAEAPGLSVFYKDSGGDIFHTYSTYGRGLEPLIGTYTILDLVPKGRDEDHLGFAMEWVRHHDRYGTDEFADADKPYRPDIVALIRGLRLRNGGAFVNSHHCCQMKTRAGDDIRRRASRWRRGSENRRLDRSSATLALLPKCPACGGTWRWPPASASPCQPLRISGRCW